MPYLILVMGTTTLEAPANAKHTDIKIPFKTNTVTSEKKDKQAKLPCWQISLDKYCEQRICETKAKELVADYLTNITESQNAINKNKKKMGYSRAVRSELPGAPVGRHCVYGAYTSLNRALRERGDTLSIVPSTANKSCPNFRSAMRGMYKTPEFDGCIFEGQMHKSNAAYQIALNKYLERNGIGLGTADSVRRVAIARFERSNFSIDMLKPGAMLLIPSSRNSSSGLHLITYMGRGRLTDGNFVPDTTGEPIFLGFNRETTGTLYGTYGRNVFAANIEKIAEIQYAKELEKSKIMEMYNSLNSNEQMLAMVAQSHTR